MSPAPAVPFPGFPSALTLLYSAYFLHVHLNSKSCLLSPPLTLSLSFSLSNCASVCLFLSLALSLSLSLSLRQRLEIVLAGRREQAGGKRRGRGGQKRGERCCEGGRGRSLDRQTQRAQGCCVCARTCICTFVNTHSSTWALDSVLHAARWW